MIRRCAKCGDVNEKASMADTEQCPSCGAVYSKAAAAAAQSRALADARARAEARRPKGKPFVERLAWLVALLGGIGGLIQLVLTISTAESAPQQGAGAALALGIAAIPYCIARAIQLGASRD